MEAADGVFGGRRKDEIRLVPGVVVAAEGEEQLIAGQELAIWHDGACGDFGEDGPNDVFTATDQNRAAVVKVILGNAVKLVQAIRAAVPGAKIGIIAPLAPADQNAFGENYGTEFDYWTYRKNQAALLRGLMEQYAGREKEGVYFVPAYLGFDPEGDYPTATQPRNSRNAEPVTRQVNALHPAEAGYLHVADGIFSWLVNVL